MKLKSILLKTDTLSRELTEEESKKLKSILLEMYKDIFSVAEEIGVTCMLSGGSCLGAVRHKGFIPWDDDMDLMLLRPEYDRLLKALSEKRKEVYRLIAPGYSDNNCYAFCKVEKIGTSIKCIDNAVDSEHGIGIDIFPIERLPANKILRFLHGIHVNALLFICACTQQKQHLPYMAQILQQSCEGRKKLILRNLIGTIFSFKSSVWWFKHTNALMGKQYKSNMMSIPSGRGHYFGEMHEADVFTSAISADFENCSALIPAGYERYLEKLYGNYMQLPPPDKRERHFIIEIKFEKFGVTK